MRTFLKHIVFLLPPFCSGWFLVDVLEKQSQSPLSWCVNVTLFITSSVITIIQFVVNTRKDYNKLSKKVI